MAPFRINNQHEWDELRAAVVGRWVPHTYRSPAIDESLAVRFPYIPAAAWEYFRPTEHGLLSEVSPDDDLGYSAEQEHLVTTLESLGVTVRRPDEIPFPTVATTQCYARDPIVTIGTTFIVTNMNFEGRRQETGSYRRIAVDLATDYDGTVVSMPPLRPGDDERNVYLEGGDVFVNGSEVYVGMSGNATNDLGIEWLRGELGRAYTVHKIPLAPHVLHLDCDMMLINERQGIVCKHDFVDFDGLPESLQGTQWVEVEPAQAQVMATNGVVINPNTIIMADAFPEVAERVRAMGIEVHEIPFAKANYFGGGLRCSYQPIERA